MRRPFFKRKKIFIGPTTYRQLAFEMVYVVVFLLLFTSTLFAPLIIRLQDTSLSFIERQQLSDEFLALHARIWPAMLWVLALFVMHSVLFSHRIAGPLYRFRQIFRAIGKGDLCVSTRIRKSDYLHKEADAIGEMVAELRERMTEIKERSRYAGDACAEIKHALRADSPDKASQRARELEAHLQELQRSINQFKTDPDDSSDTPPTPRAAKEPRATASGARSS